MLKPSTSLSFAIMQPMEKLDELYVAYREAAQRAKPITAINNNRIGAYTLVHCADTAEQAAENGVWQNVDWWYQNLAEFTLQWELPHLSEEERAVVFPFLESVRTGSSPIEQYEASDTLIIGDPDQCFEKMKKYADRGVDNLLCYMQFGNLPHKTVMRSLELIATEVMPRIERYKAGRA